MTTHPFLDGHVTLHCGDCLEVLREMPACSIDAIVTDPPYGLSFMGKRWDYDVPSVEIWAECLRVLKPGGHLLAFAGTRTQHRMAVRIEDAGFEIRDMVAWVYGSGFPKSLDVSKALDKAAGAEREVVGVNPNHRAISGVKYEGVYAGGNTGGATITAPATDAARQWQGWGTALKPALEPITVARKPFKGTVAANVLEWGTGAINIDGCRVATNDSLGGGAQKTVAVDGKGEGWQRPWMHDAEAVAAHASRVNANVAKAEALGRWPANLIHDGSDEVMTAFPQAPGQQGDLKGHSKDRISKGIYGDMKAARDAIARGDTGSAARFFYCAKASKRDRAGSRHPTVKPLALMQYLCRLVTPPGGIVLDPFAGTGTTGEAAWHEGLRAILIEREPEYQQDIARRMDLAAKPSKRAAAAKAKGRLLGAEGTPLFGGDDA